MVVATPQSLVAHFYDEAVTPERLQVLLQAWDSTAAPRPQDLGQTFAAEIARAVEVLEQSHGHDLFEIEALLRQVPDAALVVSADLKVLASNVPARALLSIQPGDPLASLPLEVDGLDLLAERLRSLEIDASRHEEVVQLRWPGTERVIHAHLKPILSGQGRPCCLIVTSVQTWPERLPAFLARHFRLTPTEIDVVRSLTSGGTVRAIATTTGRSVGTVRSQIHSVLAKTGANSQADLARLIGLLRQTVDLDTAPRPSELPSEPHHEFLRLRDGRRLEVLSFGDPDGAPVIRTQTYYGYFRLPRSAENDLLRRGLRVIVPIRAGWAGSDPAPRGRDVLEVAVADTREMMAQFGLNEVVLLTSGDDLRIALMLAQADPAMVRHIIGLGSGFPMLNEAQYRRMFPVARFVQACARYTPGVLPFLAKGFRMTMLRHGIERYVREMLGSTSSGDAAALSDQEIVEAVVAGTSYIWGHDNRMEAAFCAEIRGFREAWPEGLGRVACPVTLIHGAQDGNAPLATALDYCALYPDWRLIQYPDEGQLVGYVDWREVLDLVGKAAGAPAPALVEATSARSPVEEPHPASRSSKVRPL